ncbi:MAG: endosialidase, partial [Acetivibrio ethanolgignens]
FKQTEDETTFTVEGKEDAQITLELEPEQEFETFVNGESMGIMKTNLGGKLMLSASLEENTAVIMKVVKVNG